MKVGKEVSEAAAAVRATARNLGCRDDDPFGVVIVQLANLLTAFEDELHTFEEKLAAAKGLPIDKMEAAMRRSALTGMSGAVSAFQWGQTWRTWAAVGAAVAIAVAVGAGIGFPAGWGARDQVATSAAARVQAAFASSVSGGVWLAEVAENNDLDALDKQCYASTYQSAGGAACNVRLWLRKPPAPPR